MWLRREPVHLAVLRHHRPGVCVRAVQVDSDFRWSVRPTELSRLLEDLGYRSLRRHGASGSSAIAGLEYTAKLNPLAASRAFQERNPSDFTIVLTKAPSLLGGGYLGEYVGAAENPFGTR